MHFQFYKQDMKATCQFVSWYSYFRKNLVNYASSINNFNKKRLGKKKKMLSTQNHSSESMTVQVAMKYLTPINVE